MGVILGCSYNLDHHNTYSTIMYQLMIPAVLLVQCAHACPSMQPQPLLTRQWKNLFHPSPTPTSTAWLMIILKLISRRLRARTKEEMFKENTPLLFLMAGFSTPSTLLTH